MSSLTEVLDQAPEGARVEDRRESRQNHREEMGANAGENAREDARGDAEEDFPKEQKEPKEPEETEKTQPSGLKRAWTASWKRIGRWTRDSARFRILV